MEVEVINEDDEIDSDAESDDEDAEVYVPKIKLAEGLFRTFCLHSPFIHLSTHF